MTQTTETRRSRRKVALTALLAAILIAGAAFALSGTFGRGRSLDSEALFVVREGPLTIAVTESGTIKNREQVVIKSEVEGRNAILWLIPEGSEVEPGDKLVELDSSRLEDSKSAQQITVTNAEAAFIRARENLAVTRSQAESDVAQAELDVKFAELDLKKYMEGEYPQEQQQVEADITIAREEVQRATEKVAWSRRLHGQRYLSLMELQADELALKKAKLNLQLAEGKKSLLVEFTHKRRRDELESDLEQARRALERVKRKTSADVVQATAELKAKDSEFDRQKKKLAKIERQIVKCTVFAPVAGMVVYATTGKANWRGNNEPLEEGQEVREREELIYLPTAASMMAEVKIHESSLEKVSVGMPVRIRVDAAGGRSYTGHVAKLGILPDAQSVWLNPDLKVYNSEIFLDGDGSELKPGMSCSAEIIVETHRKAIYVPVQCVVREAGRPTVYVVSDNGEAEARTVRIGLDNNRMVHVKDGLTPGERVLLDPPLKADTAATSETLESVPEPTPVARPAGSAGEAAPRDGAKAATGASRGQTAGDQADTRERFRNATPEQRKQMMEQWRKRMDSMTPEERRRLMERFGRRGRGGGGQGQGGAGGR